MRKLSRAVYHWATTAKVRSSGAKVGKNAYVSIQGNICISDNSTIVIGDNVILASGYQIDAHKGSKICIGDNVHFGQDARIHADHGSHIIIQDGCSFNHNISIVALQSIMIGQHSIFGPYVYISDHNHKIAGGALVKDQGYDTQPVVIGDDAWLGVGATLIKGGSVGDKSVVAARAVVNTHIPAQEIWGGIPAKKLRERT